MPQAAQRGTRPENDKIGLVPCVAFAVGTMIGAGVFVLSGIAVQKAGPAALVSFLLAGVLVLLSALSFGVVASRARPGESGYAYVGRALGQGRLPLDACLEHDRSIAVLQTPGHLVRSLCAPAS